MPKLSKSHFISGVICCSVTTRANVTFTTASYSSMG
jgi:hypothetical protein